MTFPWEQTHELTTAEVRDIAAPQDVAQTVALLQKDFAYAVQYTAVLVHSNRPELSMLVNTLRGQIVPRGECKFKDGSKIEFQDIGMCQPGAPVMSVQELMQRVWGIAKELGLELEQ